MKRFLLISAFVLSAGWASAGAEAQILVIANPSVRSAEVSKSDLRDVFSGSASVLGDGQVIPVLLKAGAANDEFLVTYIGKQDGPFHAAWRSLVFSGQASMPKTVESDAAMVDYVAHTPGAVGYIAKASPHDGVKVLGVK